MLLALLLACRPPAPPASPELADIGFVPATVTGEAMGGEVRIVVRCPSADQHADCLAAGLAARAEIERIEALATDWEPGGEIARINAAAGQGLRPVSPEVRALLAASVRAAEATDGAFDPTIGALWGLWDFAGGRAADPGALAARLPLVNWRDITLEAGSAGLARPGQALTLGGIAQGYAAQRALAQIPAEWEAAVDLSGDVAVRGEWRIEVQDPRADRGTSAGTVTLRDASLSTAGDYEKAFILDNVRYHHILDPRTGYPARGAASATVVARDGALADALDTALVVRGPDPGPVAALGAWALVIEEAPEGPKITVLGDPSVGVAAWERAP